MMNSLYLFACSVRGGGFFGLPKWYKYLDGTATGHGCSPAIHGINDVWLIVAAIIEILLRIAALAAVFFVIYGGVSYITSEGDAQKTTQAKSTIINAVIGLAIAVLATAIITFIAGNVH